jgi:hypothetical protein
VNVKKFVVKIVRNAWIIFVVDVVLDMSLLIIIVGLNVLHIANVLIMLVWSAWLGTFGQVLSVRNVTLGVIVV